MEAICSWRWRLHVHVKLEIKNVTLNVVILATREMKILMHDT